MTEPSIPVPTKTRRCLLFMAVVVAVVVLIAGGIAWRRSSHARPPIIDLAGVEPEIAQAVEQASAAVRAEPRSASAWGHLGMVLRAHDFGDEANQCFAQAQRLDDRDPRWPYLRALTMVLNDRDAAIPLLEIAVARFGRQPAPRLRLAEVLLQQGRVSEAERQFRQVLIDDRDNPRAHLGLARLAHRRGDAKDALAHLNYAALHPFTRKSALMLRAEVRHHRGDIALANADLKEVATLPDEPAWPDPTVDEVESLRVGLRARLARAERLLQQDRATEALGILDDLAQSAPHADEVQLQLGQTLLRLGAFNRAEQAFRRLVALTPDAAAAHFQLGNALALQSKNRQAADSFRKAIEILPGHALAHYNLGHCLLALGDKVAAEASFLAVLRYQPDNANAHINLGDLLAQKGQNALALAHLEEALRLTPGEERATKLASEVRQRLSSAKKKK